MLLATCCVSISEAATYSYDPLGRLTSVVWDGSRRIDYVYDAAGNLIEERINGSAGLSVSAGASPSAGGTVTLRPQQSGYVTGNSITATAIPNAGYRFLGWSGLAACGQEANCAFTVANSNIALTANFQPISNLLPVRTLVAPAEGGTISPAPNPAGYPAGAQVSLTAVPAAGYSVEYWYGGACKDHSGSTCTFTMPAFPVETFVRFKKAGGTGYVITTADGFVTGVQGNVHAAGMLSVSPNQERVAAGTPVTLTVFTATGFRFDSLQLKVDGVITTNICPELVNYRFIPGVPPPSCTFPMPTGNLDVTSFFNLFLPHFALDASVAPATGGRVTVESNPTGNLETYRDGASATKYMVQGGVGTTLTARPVGGRQFIRWATGPCAASTQAVCTFVMPQSPIQATAEFGDEPSPNCSYSLTRAPGFTRSTGATKTYTVTTQADCQFNASILGDEFATVLKSGNSAVVTVPSNSASFPREAWLRIHTGREVLISSIGLSANGPPQEFRWPSTNFGSTSAGAFDGPTRSFTVSNTTNALVQLRINITNGPFTISSSTCGTNLAAGASCVVTLQFVPNKAGTFTGEFMVLGDTLNWFAPTLTGTALATRENVAAAAAGGQAFASSSLDSVFMNESATINGDRRGDPLGDQGAWYTMPAGATETLELRFAKPRTVELLQLFGRKTTNGFLASEPAPADISLNNVSGIADFSADYWTGTTWAPVTPLQKVGAPKRWQRLQFSPVTTERIRVNITSAPNTETQVAEAEVWTVPSVASVQPFALAGSQSVAAGQTVTSNAVTPTGNNVPVAVSVQGGSYSIGCTGVFTSTAGTLKPGESVCVQHTAPAAGASTTTTLTVGTQSAVFTSQVPAVVVPAADTTPFETPPQVIAGVRPATEVQFVPVTVSGINAAAPVMVSNGMVSVGCTGIYQTASTSVANGQSLCVAHTSAPTLGGMVVTTVNVGTVASTFTSVAATAADAPTQPADVTQTLSVAAGWNLLGNGLATAISPSDLGGAAQVVSIWQWNSHARKWAFYTPTLTADELAAYAQKMGYEVLQRIEANQGFWLNAKQAQALHSLSGKPAGLVADALAQGWHQVASGTGQTPQDVAVAGSGGSTLGTVSIWAWEPVQKKWFFYSPELAAKGGTALADYISSQGFLDFRTTGRKLDLGTGVWLNRQPLSDSALTPSLSIDFDSASLKALGTTFSPSGYQLVTGNNGRPAVQLAGVSNAGWLRIPNRAEMQFTDGATFDLWARIDSRTGINGYGATVTNGAWAMALFAKSHDNPSVAFNVYGSADASVPIGGAGWATIDGTWSDSSCKVLATSIPAGIGEWFRVTAIASPTTGTRVYINKKLYASCEGAKPSFERMNGQDLYVGQYSSFWYPLAGAVQDLRIYKKALTQQQVEQLP